MKGVVLKCLLLCFSVHVISAAQAQNFTGTWEGIMDDEFLQVNIEQRGDLLCGYTYDYLLARPADHCKARFEGKFDDEQNVLYLTGIRMFENSGSHVLMRLKLFKNEGDGSNTLRAMVIAKSFIGSMFGPLASEVLLKKTSSRPNKIPSSIMVPCFPTPEKPRKKDPRGSPKIPLPSRPVPTDTKRKDTSVTRSVPVRPAGPDSIAKAPAVKPRLAVDSIKIPKSVSARTQKEQGRLVVNADKIYLKIYDNGVVDNDTVSVFYDGKLLVSHQRLSEKPIELTLDLSGSSGAHKLTLFAENLGSIPPNTALIVVTAGSQRYELRSSASLEENSVLLFEYRRE